MQTENYSENHESIKSDKNISEIDWFSMINES